MTNYNLLSAMGDIDAQLILDAAPDMALKEKHKKSWVKWSMIAACICLSAVAALPISSAFIPNQATDIYRKGVLIEISDIEELPAEYNGILLAGNIDFEKAELYYDADGTAENVEDWYSLLLSQSTQEYVMTMYCMFGDTDIDDWKVKKIFKKDAVETININGVDIQTARHELSSPYAYWYYAVFKYDHVVYDIRVKSNDADCIYDVLNNVLSEAVLSLPKQKESRTIISAAEMDEEVFVEHLDTDLLNIIAEKLQEPSKEPVIMGVPDYNNSEQYRYVVNLGPKAVMPMYYILYQSGQAGLYEYLISAAMNEIIGYDFSDGRGFRWSNAYEFREIYNNCVQESISQFYAVLDDASMNRDEKISSIKNLGVFVIAPLLNELDYKYSEFDEDTIYSIIKEILGKSFDNEDFEDINVWREANEEYYRNMIRILP